MSRPLRPFCAAAGLVAGGVCVAVAGLVAGPPVIFGASPAPRVSDTTTLTIPAITMVSRATPGCPVPGSTPSGCQTLPGTAGPSPGSPLKGSFLTGAQGSLFAPLNLPAGAVLERLTIRAYDTDNSIAGPSARLVALRPGSGDLILVSTGLEGASARVRTQSATISNSSLQKVRRGWGYYLELVVPPTINGEISAQYIRVTYSSARR
jgi:hypothetical protein